MCQKPRHGASATNEAEVPLLSRSQYVEQFQQMGQSEVPRRTEVFLFHSFSPSLFVSHSILSSYKPFYIISK